MLTRVSMLPMAVECLVGGGRIGRYASKEFNRIVMEMI